MARDVRKVLGLGRHIVIPSERLSDSALNLGDERWLPKDAPAEQASAVLEGLDGIIFFERLTWSQHLLGAARRTGIATVCVPMWEWFRGEDARWGDVDLIACPHSFAERTVRSYGWSQTKTLPWPIDLEHLPRREVKGHARVFVHNAGLVDRDDRKGTRDAIQAFMQTRRRDLKLIVRLQKETDLPPTDGRIQVLTGNLDTPAELYTEGDAAIQPSKMEGLGFMILEPVCAGLPVITTDYPPMSNWVRDPEMRCRLRCFKRKAFATNWIKHAHLRLPNIADLSRRIEWCAENDLSRFSSGNRAWAEEAFNPSHLREVWAGALGAIRLGAPRNHASGA